MAFGDTDDDAQLRAGKVPRLDASAYPELGDRIDRTIWTERPTVPPA